MNSRELSLVPGGGGLSNILIQQILNEIGSIQDIISLLLTCKSFYFDFKSMYLNNITFKHVSQSFLKSVEKSMVKQRMEPFGDLFQSLSEQVVVSQWRKRDILTINTSYLSSPSNNNNKVDKVYDKVIVKSKYVGKIKRIPPTIKLKLIGNMNFERIRETLQDPKCLKALSVTNCNIAGCALSPTIENIRIKFNRISVVRITPILPPPLTLAWPSLLTFLTIVSNVALPLGVQFPSTLTNLRLTFTTPVHVFNFDLSNLVHLTGLQISSNTTQRIPIDNIQLPVPNTSIKLIDLGFFPVAGQVTQDFLSPNLETLYCLEYECFSPSVRLPPKVIEVIIDECSARIIPANFFPASLEKLDITFLNGGGIASGALVEGIKTLSMMDYTGPVTPDYIPNSVTELNGHVSNPELAVFPSQLVTLTSSINLTVPILFPPKLSKLDRVIIGSPLIYMPTSLQTLSGELSASTCVGVVNDYPVYSFPPTILINNDDSSPKHNPLHYILPSNLKELSLLIDVPADVFSFRIDQILNCSNVNRLSISLPNQFEESICLSIRRLEEDNEYILVTETDTFNGAIIKQHRLPKYNNNNNNKSTQKRGVLDYKPLYLQFHISMTSGMINI
ncbi:hypothetical protein DFA_07045 [Cavenderia fasciculata]|uniref:Uncharacterized protein n=1 Tax=Cavenderia fasciculata TaxID=261658 RepID=F4PVC3_CACFS|nr:uncharacterized protein DFA_07045 [Cavenderia fasciculata]EGG19937.1 hypothetical protein DFA_07045 [Cavenderia fasciculata]|eukprot:XP_004366920.1 hypothetical protein DFA_07045 [Cavenderia fasciculata]